jgi:hypothetical protein
MREAIGRPVMAQTCDPNATTSCAVYDLDEAGLVISSLDLVRFRAFMGTIQTPGLKCPTCPLACNAGSARSCDAP